MQFLDTSHLLFVIYSAYIMCGGEGKGGGEWETYSVNGCEWLCELRVNSVIE